MTDVSIVRCADYERVEAALLEALAPFGGLAWVRPGMQVALKINLVSGGGPERAVTPHPQLVSALCRLLAARGAKAIGRIPRYDFYEQARSAYCVVQTTESALYGCAMIRKGVIRP